MAAVAVVINGVMFPKGKAAGDKPVPCTVVGYMYDPTLSVGGGPVEPPPDIPVEPPLVIWGGPIDPHPDHGLPQPPEIIDGPPDQPPATPEKPHEGWNWSAAKSQWYYLYVPKSGDAQPKHRR